MDKLPKGLNRQPSPRAFWLLQYSQIHPEVVGRYNDEQTSLYEAAVRYQRRKVRWQRKHGHE